MKDCDTTQLMNLNENEEINIQLKESDEDKKAKVERAKEELDRKTQEFLDQQKERQIEERTNRLNIIAKINH